MQRTATLNLTPPIEDGQIKRLKGWGGSADKNVPCGDLVLEIMVEEPDNDF